MVRRLLLDLSVPAPSAMPRIYPSRSQRSATLYTLVESARRNCVDVCPYLTEVLRRIAAIAPGDTAALEASLPDRWLVAHPEHRLEQREEESRDAQARRRRKRAAHRAVTASQVTATI